MDYQIKTAPATRWYLEVRMQEKGRMPAWQAFRLLHIAFVAAPLIAGVDKFFHLLTHWDRYLSPRIASLLPVEPATFMRGVGILEIGAAILVAFKPKIGGFVLAAWLGAVILNLLIMPGFLDVALRDLGLLTGAAALSRLARHFE